MPTDDGFEAWLETQDTRSDPIAAIIQQDAWQAATARERERVESEYADMAHRFACVLEHATGGRMSKTNYATHTMYAEIDDHLTELVEAEVKEQRERDAKVAERFIVEGMTCTDTRIIHTNGAATQIAAEIRADK